MTPEQQVKLDALARTIVDNPCRGLGMRGISYVWILC